MNVQATAAGAAPRHLGRSFGAGLAAFVAVVVLSLGTDQVMHVLGIYPPWGEPMYDAGDCLLALAYRLLYTVLGGYIIARLAPRNPMRHAMVLGVVGTAVALAGAIATIPMNIAPAWYPISLVITALPCSWLGGLLHQGSAAR